MKLAKTRTAGPVVPAFWALEADDVARRVGSGPAGLSHDDAARRLATYGLNDLREQDQPSRLRVLIRQLRSPLLLLLVFAAGASLLSREWLDAAIVMAIVVATVGVGYSRESSAQSAVILIPIAFAIPYTPVARVLGFVPLPATLVGAIVLITSLYVAATELQKRSFYRSRD